MALDFEALFDATPNPYMVLDRELRYVAANQAYLDAVGRRREELIGRHIFEVFPHDLGDPQNESVQRLFESFQRVIETGERDVLALIHYRTPEDNYWSATHTPIRDESGQVAFVLQHTVKVTERRRASDDGFFDRVEAMERRSAARDRDLRRMAATFAQAPGFLAFLRGPEHIFEMANSAYERLVGGRQVIGKTIRAALPEIEPAYYELLDRVLHTGEPFIGRGMQVALQRGGKLEDVFVDFIYQPIIDDGGAPLGILVSGHDITQQKAAESARERLLVEAEEARAWLQSAVEQAPTAIVVLRGPDLVVEIANRQALEIWRKGAASVLGRPLAEAMPELVAHGFAELVEKARKSGQPYVGRQIPARMGDDRERFFDLVIQPLAEGDSVVTIGTDVTEDVLAQRLVQATQAELEAILAGFPEAIYAGDARGIRRVNTAARDMLGYRDESDLHRSHQSLVAETQPRRADTGEPVGPNDTPFGRALRGEATRAELMVTDQKTGEDRYLLSSGAPVVVDGHIVGAVVTHVDMTERRRAAMEAQKLARVLDASRDFVGISDLTGKPTFANEAALRLVGLPDRAAAFALTVFDLFAERERAHVRDEVFPAAIRDGYWSGELHFVHRETREEIPVLYNVFPLTDEGGNVIALATITRDLRAQKIAEEERARLLANERAARAEAELANLLKDQFLATVSHELRTPLTSMLGWMQMLRTGLVPPDKQARALETVERNARVQAQLIDDLLDVSRIISGKLELESEPVDLAGMVASAVEIVRPMADAAGVALSIAIESAGLVIGDGRRLQQVVWNLLSNGVKFTPRGGAVRLRVERHGDLIEIRVSDTGAGIAPDFLPHVFEPFRQADRGSARQKGGLGLGLSIVRHVISAHGGGVSARSDGEGKGATFIVTLPLAMSASRPLRPVGMLTGLQVPPALAGKHILVVDDDEDTREYVRALLLQCRARVTVAGSTAEALDALERERPDLILSDLGMPVEDGYVLVQRVRALPPERGGATPAVALTAFAQSDDRARAMLAGFQNHVRKPVEPDQLLTVLAALLGRH